MHWLKRKQLKGGKKIITYNKFFGTSFMKRRVEVEHLEFLFTYLWEFARVEGISRSQTMNDGDNKAILLHAKKCPKVSQGVIFTFFGSKCFYKKQDETHKLFWEDLMLLMAKVLSFQTLVKTCVCTCLHD